MKESAFFRKSLRTFIEFSHIGWLFSNMIFINYLLQTVVKFITNAVLSTNSSYRRT